MYLGEGRVFVRKMLSSSENDLFSLHKLSAAFLSKFWNENALGAENEFENVIYG